MTFPQKSLPPQPCDLEKLQSDADIPHLPTPLTFEARRAVSGEGELASQWADKPHRLVFILSRQLECVATTVAKLHTKHPHNNAIKELYMELHKRWDE